MSLFQSVVDLRRSLPSALIVALTACGGGGEPGPDENPTPRTAGPNEAVVSVAIDQAIPATATKSITTIATEIDAQPVGTDMLVPTQPLAKMPSVVFADDDEGNVILAAINNGTRATLTADTTALALARILIDADLTQLQEASVQAALRSAPGYTALVNAITTELAVGRPPTQSTTVASAALEVISQAATTLGMSTPASLDGAPRAHALAVVGTAPVQVKGPMPYTILDLASGCTSPLCERRVKLVGGDDDGVTVENSTLIGWALRSADPAGAVIDDALVLGIEGIELGLPEPRRRAVRGNGIRFNITASQSEASIEDNLKNVVIDIFKVALLPLGAWVPESRACFVPVADIVLNETALAHRLATSSSSSGINTELSDYFTEQKLAELAQPVGEALKCIGITYTSSNVARAVISRGRWAKTVLRAIPLLGQAYAAEQALGGVATAIVRYYETVSQAATERTVQVCQAAGAGVVNCPARYELAPASSTRKVGEQFALSVKAYDVDGVETPQPKNLAWHSSDDALLQVMDAVGTLRAAAAGTATVSVEDPFDANMRAESAVSMLATQAHVTITGKVLPGSNDCVGYFIVPRLLPNGAVDLPEDGNLTGLDFELRLTLDVSKGYLVTDTMSAALATPTFDYVPPEDAPLFNPVLTIGGKSMELARLGPRVSAKALASKSQPGAGPAGYVVFNYALSGGSSDGSNMSIFVDDPQFLAIFAGTPDITKPYAYRYDSSNTFARQQNALNILSTATNNHGCGSIAATASLLVDTITVAQ